MVAELRQSEVRKLAQASRGRRKKGALVIECDELWSFVDDKGNKQWVWLAMDRATREIVGCHVGARDEAGAVALWQSLPECYLDAETYTDYWKAYRAIFYADTLHQVGKKSGQTNHIERFNNTLRQRCPRLVRKTLSFSKNFDNHIGAIWTFIHHYNKSLPLCSTEKTLGSIEKGVTSLIRPWTTRREGQAGLELRKKELLMLEQTRQDIEDVRLGKKAINERFEIVPLNPIPDERLTFPSAEE